MTGPLAGLTVVELAGLGAAPHAGMMLADLGADVLRVVGHATPTGGYEVDTHLLRGRRTLKADLKNPAERDELLARLDDADVLLEGFRPGVAERLGLGPQAVLARNPRLVYARMTGWGQDGPLANTAGHDINYLALAGALHAVGTADTPLPPLNLVGDFGGGSMLVVTGILAALWERERSGQGQVVDAAMVDGVALLSQLTLELRSVGLWKDQRAANILDGGAPYYRTYACADGGHVAVGAIEPQFYAQLVAGLGLELELLPDRDDRTNWAALTEVLASAFAAQPRDHWAALFEQTDACLTPVLSFAEAAQHPHVKARGTLAGAANQIVAAPAPRFSRSGPAAETDNPTNHQQGDPQ